MKTRWIKSLPVLALWMATAGFCPTVVAGTALLLDGVSDVVNVPGFGSNLPTNEITVEFWQRVDRVKVQATFIFGPDQTTNRFLAHLPYSDGRCYWDYGNYTNRGRLAYVAPVSLTNAWHHFALVVSKPGNFMRIYRNGVLEASTNTSSSFAQASFALLIGGNGTYRFGGQIDEMRVWDVARSQAQVQTHLNRELTGTESNLFAYWRFNEGSGLVAGDSSGNGRNGTLSRSNLWVFSTAPIGAPVATTLPVMNVAANSATLTGTVFTANQTTPAWFEYGLTTNYGASSATNSIAASTNTAGYGRNLTGLAALTTYHVRLRATNNGGASFGEDYSFTTPTGRPAVSTLSANAVTTNSARLRATANPNGLETVAWFEYGLTTNYGAIAGVTNLGSGVASFTFSNVVTGLLPGRGYAYRVVATNGLGTNFGVNQNFTVPIAPPVAMTLSAENVTASSARLVGTVNPNGGATRFHFQYGATTNLGSTTASTNLAAGNIALTLTGTVANLLPVGLYYYRAVATNIAGTNFGARLSFTTPALRPLVTTLSADSIRATNAMLHATVNPNGAETGLFFEYGSSTNYGSQTVVSVLSQGNGVVAVSNDVSGLFPGVIVHFRAVATNSAGASFGVDSTFTTLAEGAPPITTFAAQPGGSFLLGFNGAAGGIYSVLSSTNLSNWIVLGLVPETTPGVFQYLDTNGFEPRQFYRLRAP